MNWKRLLFFILVGIGVLNKGVAQKLPYSVPEEKRVRVIVSTDAANEVDDAYFILHALLTPQFDVRGVVAAHFGGRRPNDLQLSYEECQRVLCHSGFEGKVALLKGAARKMADESTPVASDGAELIASEAMKDDSRPLYVLCGGPLTDVASAILLHPEIAGRLTVVWTGGAPHNERAKEFNLSSDVHAANAVLASRAEFWQIPNRVYWTVRTGTAELALKVKPCGKIGEYLFTTLMAFNEEKRNSRGWPRGEDWTLGDNPLVTVLMNTHQDTDKYDELPAPLITPDYSYEQVEGRRKIRVYWNVDVRMVLEDFFAKMQLAYGRKD